MLVPLRWLREYVDFPWNVKVLAERLTAIGNKVEGVRESEVPFAGVVVGLIVSCEPHPTAERLRVCQVNVGQSTVQVITGAPNGSVGDRVAVALPGSRLPGRDEPISAATLAGVHSAGMLCSESELGLGDDASGLLLLPAELEPGVDLASALGLEESIIEFEIYPNRPDCLSVVGIAREVAALTGTPLRLPTNSVTEHAPATHTFTSVAIQEPDLCARYTARVIRGVRIAPSPLWLQQRLRAAGMRPINNVVDVTNYVMLELGQPLHAFDYDLLSEHRIVVRRAEAGEVIRTLDGVVRTLDPHTLVIADATRPVAIAGVMGGADTEVSDGTTNILLESAHFHPESVRKTGRRLGLRTEASARFEKGLDPHLTEWAVDRAAQLIAELAGGQVAKGRVDARAGTLRPPIELVLRSRRVNNLLGTQLSPAEIKRALKSLGFEVDLGSEGVLSVRVPTFRTDIERETDLIEEVARIYGYDRIEATLPSGSSNLGVQGLPLQLYDKIRSLLVGAGLYEVLTYSFISPRHTEYLSLPVTSPLRRQIALRNPLSDEQSLLRTSLLPGVLDIAARNMAHRADSVHVFELGATFHPRTLPPSEQPEERRGLAILLAGRKLGVAWGDRERDADFYDLKGLVEMLCERLGIAVSIEPIEAPPEYMHPGRCAMVLVDGQQVGLLGEVHPNTADAYGISARAYVAEMNLDAVLAHMQFAEGRRQQRVYRPIPRHPAVIRDLALLAPVSVLAGAISKLIIDRGRPLVQAVDLFDIYQGEQIPEGFRSLAYRLTFQADRTLTDAEVNEAVGTLAKALAEELGVTVRG